MKAVIVKDNGALYYYDKNGVELKDGDVILWDGGQTEKLYRTEQGELGTDATNPQWIKTGKATPCEYGIYPLSEADLATIRKATIEKQV